LPETENIRPTQIPINQHRSFLQAPTKDISPSLTGGKMEALEVDIVPVQTRSFLAPPTKLGAGTNSNNNLNVPSKIDLLVAGKPTSPRRTSETPK